MEQTVPRLSVNAYAVLFSLLTALLFVALGWVTLQDLEKVQLDVQAANRSAADRELSRAVQTALEYSRGLADDLASWDEVHQQLGNPTYYAYWREHRLMQSGRLPPFFSGAEVYGPEGKALGDFKSTNMPTQVPAPDSRPYLWREGERIDLLLFVPIADAAGGISGHVGVRGDFHHQLVGLTRYRYLDEASLDLQLPASRVYPLRGAEYAGLFHYQLREDPESAQVSAVMRNVVFRLAIVVGGLTLLFYLMMAMLLGAPMRRLSRYIDRLKHQAASVDTVVGLAPMPVAELENVRNSLMEYQRQLCNVHQRLDDKNRELWELAHHDPLTGALNRRAFEDDWARMREVVTGQRLGVSFMLFDCNHFKAINDTYGHEVGDEVLKAVVSSVQLALRGGDRVYRMGGDEFSTLLLDCPTESALFIAARCVTNVAHFDFTGFGVKEPVRISIGHSFAEGLEAIDLADLPRRADIAMYAAKRPGSSHIASYSEDMHKASGALFSSELTDAVFGSITSGRNIEMHYQPVVSLDDGSVPYYEALMRVRRDGGLVMPDDIFPLVRARGLEPELDRAVAGQVLRDIAEGRIPPGTGVSMNISGETVLLPDLVEWLSGFVDYMDSYRLVIEVTETTIITQLQQASDNLTRLREMGFEVALDDFGSGYSSFRYLANMPVDMVKFDISMIHSLLGAGSQSRIVRDVAAMTADAGYSLVAEGIENDELLAQVVACGFGYGQGWLFGRPQAADDDLPVNVPKAKKGALSRPPGSEVTSLSKKLP